MSDEVVEMLSSIAPFGALFLLFGVFLKVLPVLFGCSPTSSVFDVLDCVLEEKNDEIHKSLNDLIDSGEKVLDEMSEKYDCESVKKLDMELRKNDTIKITHVSQSREIPLRCPNCWGIPDDSGVCQYCGSRLV